MNKPSNTLSKLFVVACLLCATSLARAAAPAKQKTFASPEDAVSAFVDAMKQNNAPALLEILGGNAADFLETGDEVVDRENRERFVHAYEASHKVENATKDSATLEVGKDDWPFPIPLVKEKDAWRFDTKQGRQEILNRSVGRNELDVIQVCLAYVDAQNDYYRLDPDKDSVLEYAQLFASTPGKRDGLYWETKSGEEPSPLGPLVAEAKAKGYKKKADAPTPYHGYLYKILTAQGKNASGGAYDYVVNGKMIGGFALVAYPAQYGSSGIMTFIVNHSGIVYQKDLGANTASRAATMKKFDPDKTWFVVKGPREQ